MLDQKKILRQQALARRNALSTQQRSLLAKKTLCYIESLMPFLMKGVVAGFWPIGSEMDPRFLLRALADRQVQIALPAIVEDNQMVFRMFDFCCAHLLVDMPFATKGPSSQCAQVDPATILMPLTAFDDNGNRIGYGGGYYDRTIAEMASRGVKANLIGIAFCCQHVASIPVEEWDVRLHAILTEKGFYSFS